MGWHDLFNLYWRRVRENNPLGSTWMIENVYIVWKIIHYLIHIFSDVFNCFGNVHSKINKLPKIFARLVVVLCSIEISRWICKTLDGVNEPLRAFIHDCFFFFAHSHLFLWINMLRVPRIRWKRGEKNHSRNNCAKVKKFETIISAK